MIIETWIAVLIVAFIFILGAICALGWMAADKRLEKCHKEMDRMQSEIHFLRGKLIVKTSTEFYNEGKKK